MDGDGAGAGAVAAQVFGASTVVGMAGRLEMLEELWDVSLNPTTMPALTTTTVTVNAMSAITDLERRRSGGRRLPRGAARRCRGIPMSPLGDVIPLPPPVDATTSRDQDTGVAV